MGTRAFSPEIACSVQLIIIILLKCDVYKEVIMNMESWSLLGLCQVHLDFLSVHLSN